ncbi:MAG: zinc-ribbon domain-containing protein [Promethearchaeota archaeon]
MNKKDPECEPYCKYCGAKLPIGQSICHVCGKKVL